MYIGRRIRNNKVCLRLLLGCKELELRNTYFSRHSMCCRYRIWREGHREFSLFLINDFVASSVKPNIRSFENIVIETQITILQHLFKCFCIRFVRNCNIAQKCVYGYTALIVKITIQPSFEISCRIFLAI